MKNFKKTIKLVGIGLLIVLACLGIGVGGAIPISSNKKKENANEIKTELVEGKQDKTKTTQIAEIKH